MFSNIYLKFSDLAVGDKQEGLLSNAYGITSVAILTDFLSLGDTTYSFIEELVVFINEKGNRHFSVPVKIAILLQKVARDSYLLDKAIEKLLTTQIQLNSSASRH